MPSYPARLFMFVAVLVLFLSGCQEKQTAHHQRPASSTAAMSQPMDPVVQQMLIASGLEQFDHVTQMQFTFNVHKQGKTIQRKWVWHPKQDNVTYTHVDAEGKLRTLSYQRSDVASHATASSDLKMADQRFVNDTFWLMMPLHLSWQNPQDLEVVDHGIVNYPLGQGSGRHVTVAFKDARAGGGGYSPGDVYELFLDDQNLIAQWIYRKGGSEKPTLTNTFEDYESVGPFRLGLNHQNPNGARHWFTDIKITTDLDH